MSDKDCDVELDEETDDSEEEFSGVAWQNRSRKGKPILDYTAFFRYLRENPDDRDLEKIAEKFTTGYYKE